MEIGLNFSRLANFLDKLEDTSPRNRMINTLTDLFKEASIDSISKICYFMLGALPQATKSPIKYRI